MRRTVPPGGGSGKRMAIDRPGTAVVTEASAGSVIVSSGAACPGFSAVDAQLRGAFASMGRTAQQDPPALIAAPSQLCICG